MAAEVAAATAATADAAAVAVGTTVAGRACFPGDVLSEVDAFERVVLGPGVAREDTSLVATRVGVVRWEEAQCLLWVESDLKRYWPGLGDHVIGIVADKGAEDYKLDIGAASKALLPVLAFDGASKRNRPHLAVGALVYARVVLANRDMEPEVTCAAPPGVNARDWVTKESVFGELSGGHVFDCPQSLCRQLMSTESPVLEALGSVAPFEIAVGTNGRVWIDSKEETTIVLAQTAILQSQSHASRDHSAMVQQIGRRFDLT